MQTSIDPTAERKRLAALAALDILDTPPDPVLDQLVALASLICGTPIALVTLLDDHRQWFKARVGVDVQETARDISFCTHAIEQDDLFVVSDALTDERFARNPLVTGDPSIRFYAGAPLRTPDGFALGTLCVIDRVPRQLSADQERALSLLGAQVATHIHLQKQADQMAAAQADRQRAESRARMAEARLEASPGATRSVTFGFVAALLFLLVIGAVVLQSTAQTSELSAERTAVRNALVASKSLFSAVQDAGLRQRRFLLTGNEADLKPYAVAQARIEEELARHEQRAAVTDLPGQDWSEVQDLIAQRIALLDEGVQLRRQQGVEAAIALVEGGRGRETLNQIRARFATLERLIVANLDAKVAQQEKLANRMLMGVSAGGMLSASLLVLVYVWLRREIARNLRMTATLRQNMRILDAASDSIFIRNDEHKITYWNKGAERLYGWTEAEALGQVSHDLLRTRFPIDRKVLEQQFERQGSWNGELQQVSKQGGVVTVLGAWTRAGDQSGPLTQVLEINRDLSERKRAEEQFRLVVESAPSGLLVVNSTGTITLLNAQAELLFGFTRAELLGQPVDTLLPDDLRHGHETHRAAFGKDPRARPMGEGRDLLAKRKNGSRFQVEIGLSPMHTANGLETLCTVLDITERHQVEQAMLNLNERLRAATEQAQSADRLKSTFLATMSHELRTPLNSIIGFTGILIQKLAGPLTEEQARQLNMVRGSARHLLALINDVLDISKIEAGQMTLASEPFDLAAAITKTVGLIRPLAEAKGLAMAIDLPDNPVMLVGDQRRMEQILLNLLSNAVKFTEAGSVSLKVEPSGDKLNVSIADTGIGITPQDLTQLFQPFKQVEDGLARNHEGTGLGLAICARLAELMGGAIRAQSELGQGSVFTLVMSAGAGQASDAVPGAQ